MQRDGMDTGYPGLEKEQLQPNTSGLRVPARTPLNSPLAGRQEKPGAWSAGAFRTQPLGLSRPGAGLFGKAAPATSQPSHSMFTDASAEPTLSALQQPADSCDITVEGPAAKRLKLAIHTHGYGLHATGAAAGGTWAFTAGSAASCDSDSDGEEAVVSRKQPTPAKAPPAAAAAAAAAATMAPARAPAQHPPPTWAASMGAAAAATAGQAAAATHDEAMQDGDAWAEGDEGEGCSDMEGDNFVGSWQPRHFPWPHPLDVEE